MVQLLSQLMLFILLRQNLKSVHLSLNQWQCKLLQKLDLWLLKQQPGCGSPNGRRLLPNPALAGPPHIGLTRRQEVQKLKVQELVVLELEVQDLEVQDLEVLELEVQELEVQELEVQELVVQELVVQELEVKELEVQELEVQELEVQDLLVQELQVWELEVKQLEIMELVLQELEVQKPEGFQGGTRVSKGGGEGQGDLAIQRGEGEECLPLPPSPLAVYELIHYLLQKLFSSCHLGREVDVQVCQ